MTARSQHRGHPIHWTGNNWIYTDWSDVRDLQYGKERPCTHCGRQVGVNDPDACLGRLRAVRAACCGHGNPKEAYIAFYNGLVVRGEDALKLRQTWIDLPVTPETVLTIYLALYNVDDVRDLCQLSTRGASQDELIMAAGVLESCRRQRSAAEYMEISKKLKGFCDAQ